MSEILIAVFVTVAILAAMFAFVPCQMHLEKRCEDWKQRRQAASDLRKPARNSKPVPSLNRAA